MSPAPRALVLGGATGLLGQSLVEVLRASGWTAIAPTRQQLDLTDSGAADVLAALMDVERPECVFNTVAYTAVDKAESEPEAATRLNRAVPAMIGRVLKTRPSRLIHFSTDFVFNGKKDTPYTTEDATNPTSVYGKTKRAGEEALQALDLPELVIIRTAWLFGPHKGNFVRTILNLCKERKSVNVVHDQIGSPTYTPDLAQYSLKLVESGHSGVFHIANSGHASWCELAAEAVNLAQAECMVNAVPSSAYPQKAVRPAYSVLDTGSFTRVTGITPRPWPQALREYIFHEFPPDRNHY